MDFVLALHSHLPYVLNHGRWPHGSDWLCEAAVDTYLPLLESLQRLAGTDVPAPVTIGFTPVLANQLTSPVFRRELEEFFAQRLDIIKDAPQALRASGDTTLIPLAGYWKGRFSRLRTLFQSIDGDLCGAFRRLEEDGRIEIIGSAATHGYLPLLGRDESIRLQLAVGRQEHRRIFGKAAAGLWLPECAYRRSGKWAPPGAPHPRTRRGIEEHLADAGVRFFFTDSHLARAGAPLAMYGDVPLGTERFDAERHDHPSRRDGPVEHTPYHGYRVNAGNGKAVTALVRDPRSSMQVWSRHQGYPGDEWYLEFHKIRWPGGLKLWRVTGSDLDLGAKLPYDPTTAQHRVNEHARHFTELLGTIAAGQPARQRRGNVIVAPFDTELFGHWWFEGVDFLAAVYGHLAGRRDVRAVTGSRHLKQSTSRHALRLAEGSWGVNGDHSMWLNDGTAWTWQRLWALEDAFWDVAPKASTNPAARPVLAQAARELLLAQASDWQFIISTGAVADYAERRFTLHCDDAERLVAALSTGELAAGTAQAEELQRRDDLFPDILTAVTAALAGGAIKA